MKFIFLLAAYFLGAIPTGYWLGLMWKGVDVRKQGSGNLGATNVFRVLGKGPGSVTLFLDIVKGLLPVLVAEYLYPGQEPIAVIAGLLAVLGHTTSPFVGFRGGKGVATSTGVFAALLPMPMVIAVITFILMLTISGFVSLSSMVAAMALALAAHMLKAPESLQIASLAIAAFVMWTHRANIQRLRAGTENRIR